MGRSHREERAVRYIYGNRVRRCGQSEEVWSE